MQDNGNKKEEYEHNPKTGCEGYDGDVQKCRDATSYNDQQLMSKMYYLREDSNSNNP